MTGSGGQPTWLPALHSLRTHGGNWAEYEEALYTTFRKDFVESKPTSVAGRSWGLKRGPLTKGKEATFWHLISEGKNEEERLPDLARCERLCWVRPIIDRMRTADIHSWEQRRPRNERRIALSLLDFSFVVIIADRGTHLLPWTAFPVDYPHRRAKLRAEHAAFVALKQPLF